MEFKITWLSCEVFTESQVLHFGKESAESNVGILSLDHYVNGFKI